MADLARTLRFTSIVRCESLRNESSIPNETGEGRLFHAENARRLQIERRRPDNRPAVHEAVGSAEFAG